MASADESWVGGSGERMIVITDESGLHVDETSTYIIPMPEGETVEIMNDSTGEHHQILMPNTQFIQVDEKYHETTTQEQVEPESMVVPDEQQQQQEEVILEDQKEEEIVVQPQTVVKDEGEQQQQQQSVLQHVVVVQKEELN